MKKQPKELGAKKSIFYGLLLGLLVTMIMGAALTERGDRYFLDRVTFKLSPTFVTGPVFSGTPVFSNPVKTTYGNGSAVTNVDTATEYGDGIIHKTILTFTNYALALTDTANSSGLGHVKIYGFPAGAIEVEGATTNLTASSATGSQHGLVAAADGDFALGTTTSGVGKTLTGTAANVIGSTELAQFANTAGVIKGYSASSAIFDGTTTSKDLFLNTMFDDADSTGNDTLYITGTITVVWKNLGDY